MFLLSKFFPKLLKPEKHRGYESETGHGGEKPKDYQCKVILLDDSELNLTSKVSFIMIMVDLDSYYQICTKLEHLIGAV